MPPPNPPEPNLLLVEGQDDKHVILHLCLQYPNLFTTTTGPDHNRYATLQKSGNRFLISDRNGRSAVIKALPQEIRTRGRQIVGAILDADDNIDQAWQEIIQALSPDNLTLTLPDKPHPAGLIIPEQPPLQPRLGIWIMPDNQSLGELEDFAIQMIPKYTPQWEAAQRYVDSIPSGNRKFAQDKADKAKLYAWLATLKEPTRIGAAISSQDLETKGPLCQEFIQWLQDLYA